MVKPNDHVRVALEEAKQRPLPPPEERERLMEMARAAMKTPEMSTEEFLAMMPSGALDNSPSPMG